eukprot:scaffold9.g3027.t1
MLALKAAPALRPAAMASVARRSGRRANFVSVRASAEPEQPTATDAAPAAPVVEAPAAPTPTPVYSAPKTPSFGEVMAFNGAPELINGRLAMLGFLVALGAELSSGEGVAQQLGAGGAAIPLAFAVFVAASLVPVFKGAVNDEAFGPFTPMAEQLNGRAAMLGFAGLLIMEALNNGAALF